MPIQNTIVFPENASSAPGFDRFSPIPTVKDLKDRYLHGVDLRDNRGVSVKRSVFQFYIDAAISALEHELQITINPTTYVETHDYRFEEYYAWGFIQLRRKPAISVTKLEYKLAKDNPFVEVPTAWIQLESHPAQIQIVPTTASIGEFNLGNLSYMPRTLVFNPDWPSFFRFTYTAGFENGKTPAIISQTIGMMAALQMLNIAGDLILGAGIASTGISLDGLSQSVASTASASYSGYGARIELYQKDLKHNIEILKGYYGRKVKLAIC